jgi:predicted solute-binding protein
MILARPFQLAMRKAKKPTCSVFLTSRATTSSLSPHVAKSSASVTSITISELARNPTSPAIRPKPESM